MPSRYYSNNFRAPRKIILGRKIRMIPKRAALSIDIDLIVDNLDSGDWKVFYHLLRNMDALVRNKDKFL